MLKSNYYVYNVATGVKNFGHNLRMHKFVDPLLEIDPVSDYEAYKDYIIKWKSSVPEGVGSYNFRRCNLETTMYGHGKALYKYAYAGFEGEVPYRKIPYVEHGIYFGGNYWPIAHHFSIISQGTFREEILHKTLPELPIFSVGPLVHYAEPMISETEISEYKKKLGKTLFVFPTHDYENSKTEYGRQSFVDSIMNTYAKSFDTVLVSAFWNDVADPVYDMFKAYGAKIVSCGFKFDTNFIRRLKTLMLVSDATLGNSLGTHIGYSLYLNRPHILIPCVGMTQYDKGAALRDDKIGKNERFSELSKFWDILSYQNYLDGVDNRSNSMYKEYWGGDECVKAPEEIRAIIEINTDLIKSVGGRFRRKLEASRLLLRKYEKDNDTLKYSLLRESVKI